MKDKLFKTTKLLASDSKNTEYKYIPRVEALEKRFIQFNRHAITSIIIDIDHVDQEGLKERLQSLPEPSIIVKTQKGFHVHYVLKYPIGYSKIGLVSWARKIKTAMLLKIGGDIHANGVSARVYRNPWKHEAFFSGREYTLKELSSCVELKDTRRTPQTSKGTFRKDFSSALEGTRHDTLFNYLRFNAYRLKDRSDLQQILEYLAHEANNTMPKPLPTSQVDALVLNICGFMSRYVGRPKEQVVAYNQALAKEKHEKTMKKVFASITTISFKEVCGWSARKIAGFVGVSNSTISKHLQYIIQTLKNTVLKNIQLSFVWFMGLIIPSYSLGFQSNIQQPLNFGGTRYDL